MNDVINGELIQDLNGKWLWKTADGRQIAVENMTDNHLRNASLFLMGMGYAKCIATTEQCVVWLRIFRVEWERRMVQRANERMMNQLRDHGWNIGKQIRTPEDLQRLIDGDN